MRTLSLTALLSFAASYYVGNPPWPNDPTQPALRAAGGARGK